MTWFAKKSQLFKNSCSILEVPLQKKSIFLIGRPLLYSDILIVVYRGKFAIAQRLISFVQNLYLQP